MKTFEEKWTAWLDGQLTGRELADFEAALPDRAAAEAEKNSALKLGALLKRELGAPVLTNEDFFNHQLRERISREEASGEKREPRSTWWTVPRLVWCGAAALAVFVVVAVNVLPDDNQTEQSRYTTELIGGRIDPVVNPNASMRVFETGEDRVTVLWTEGLQTLPADYASK